MKEEERGILDSFFFFQKYQLFVKKVKKMEKCGQYRASVGVAPIWHDGHGLIWVDAIARKVITYHPTTKKENIYDALGWLKAIVPLVDGRFIGVYKDGLYYLNFIQGMRTPFAIFENTNDLRYVCDAKCGPDGKVWLNMTDGFYKSFKQSPHTTLSQYPFENTEIFSVNAQAEVEKRIGNITLVSGFDWHHQTKKFFYIDSLKREIFQYQLDKKSEIQFERVVYTFSKEDGFPGSMTVDFDGNIWVTLVNDNNSEPCKSTRIICINPILMTIITEYEIPVTHITSCVIGGEKMNTLFITTAYEQLPLEKIKHEPFAGYVIAFDIEQQGIAHYEFATMTHSQAKVY